MNTKKLIEVLEDHDLSPLLVEGDTELVVACPLCYSEDRKLYISTDTASWICFKCDSRGGLRSLLLEVCEMPANEAYPTEHSLLAGKKQVPGLIVSRPAPASSIELPKGFSYIVPLDGSINPRGTAAYQYLEGRGVSYVDMMALGFGFCLAGYYKHRVIVPVFTQGKLRTYVARSWLKDVQKKVVMPAGSQAERALFGYDTLVNERGRWQDLILVEGVFGAMRMWRAGYRETVATLGAHVTELQRNLVKRLKPRNVVLLRDTDDAGRDAAIKEGMALSEAMLNVKIANLPDGADIDLVSDSTIHGTIQSARPVTHQLGIEAMKEEHSGN